MSLGQQEGAQYGVRFALAYEKLEAEDNRRRIWLNAKCGIDPNKPKREPALLIASNGPRFGRRSPTRRADNRAP